LRSALIRLPNSVINTCSSLLIDAAILGCVRVTCDFVVPPVFSPPHFLRFRAFSHQPILFRRQARQGFIKAQGSTLNAGRNTSITATGKTRVMKVAISVLSAAS